ncbi:MAG: DUF523 domain-containing protein [Alphaproteobacteria bacterium]|nr:DUF523 domain-containing protein [Alphaproteobacteria bacterium]
MRKILVSTCLLGQAVVGYRVRYNNGDMPCVDPRFRRWRDEGRFVHICPEVTGGLPTPRPRARVDTANGRVVTEIGTDVTAEYERGAQAALALAWKHGITLAILKQASPSCGSRLIFDRDFKNQIPGQGRTAALLAAHGIKVFGEDQLDEVERELTASD